MLLSARSLGGGRSPTFASRERVLRFYVCARTRSYTISASPPSQGDLLDQQSSAQTDVAFYGSLLRSCGDGKLWKDGMVAHHQIILDGLAHDLFLQGLLVQMYGKCGSLDHALQVFCAMPEHSAYSWNFIIRASAQQERYQDALDLFSRMQQQAAAPDKFTYVSAFAACAGKGDLYYNVQTHARIIGSSIESDTALGTAVVHMYGKCGRVGDAKRNFEKLSECDAISWNVLLLIYVEQCHTKEALQFFCDMQQENCFPTPVSFLCMLEACTISSKLAEGKRFHVYILAAWTEVDTMVNNALINMYGKFCFQHAEKEFQSMPERNVVTWTIMIASCTKHGQTELAFHLYDQMCQEDVLPDKVTFLEVLAACITSRWLYKGERLFACLTGIADDIVMTEVVTMYGRCSSTENARKVFDLASSQSIVAWNAMISVYSQHGEANQAFQHFAELLSKLLIPSSVTFISMLGTCAKIFEGRALHAFVIETNFEFGTSVGNAIISMYGRNFLVEDAWSIFTGMPERDIISWNAMILVYALDDRIVEAFSLLAEMANEGITPDKVTYTTILEAYSHCTTPAGDDQLDILRSQEEWLQGAGSTASFQPGRLSVLYITKRLFYELPEQDVRAWNAMINVYNHQCELTAAFSLFHRMLGEAVLPNHDSFISIISACSACEGALMDLRRLHCCVCYGEFELDFAVGTVLITTYGDHGIINEARKVFDRFTNKNVVLWTAMISVYARGWLGDEGFKLFGFMQQCGILPNQVTYVSALEACVIQGSLNEGKSLHARIARDGLLSDIPVVTALIDMYSKCGRLDDAHLVFDEASSPDSFLWNTMISLYSQHGDAWKAFTIVRTMDDEGFKADKVTFISILSVCSHCGLIEDGFYWLNEILQDYCLCTSSAHFVCMIDVVGRAGQLNVAWALISRMPFQPTEVPYIMLLRASQQGADVKHGGWAAIHSFELGSENAAPYVLLSNIKMADRKRF